MARLASPARGAGLVSAGAGSVGDLASGTALMLLNVTKRGIPPHKVIPSQKNRWRQDPPDLPPASAKSPMR